MINNGIYERDFLIGRPNLTLKNFKCQNITCQKDDKFKKFKEGYLCECGYYTDNKYEIELQHKLKLYCKSVPCPYNKTKMNKDCLKCPFIGER